MKDTAVRLFVFALSTLVSFGCVRHTRVMPTRPPDSQVRPATGDELGERWLIDTARAAESAGANKLRLIAFGAGNAGDKVDGFVFVPAGRCALAFSRATDSVQDLDLLVYGDDGTQFGSDESPDDLPTLLICPEKDERLYLSARVAQGQGLVALGVQDVPSSRANAVARAVGARNHNDSREDSAEAWPGLDAALTQHRQDLGGKWIDQRRVALPVDARVPSALTVVVPRDGCLDVLVLPGPEVSELGLTASDERGRIFARSSNDGRDRFIFFCSEGQEGRVTLSIRPYAGRGMVVAALSVMDTERTRLGLNPNVRIHHLTPPSTVTRVESSASSTEKRLRLKSGEISSWEPHLSACTRIDLKPMHPLLGFEVRTWSSSGTLLGELSTHQPAPLFVCHQGSIRLDAEAVERSGELSVQLREDRQTPKNLISDPQAGGRLLAQAEASGLITMPHELGQVARVAVSATQLTRIPLSVPVAHCQTIVAARGDGGWGLRARVLDDKTGLEIDSSQGEFSIETRLCATQGSHLNATLELRAVRGESVVLWASRQTKRSTLDTPIKAK